MEQEIKKKECSDQWKAIYNDKMRLDIHSILNNEK